MSFDKLTQIRKNIIVLRGKCDYLPGYLGIWGMHDRCLSERKKRKGDALFNTIDEALEDYIHIGEEYLKKESQSPSNDKILTPLLVYCIDAIDDPYFNDADRLLPLAEAVYGDGSSHETSVKVVLLYVILQAYLKNTFTWRGKPYAKQLRSLIQEAETHKKIYTGLASFYKAVLDYPSAVEVALFGAEKLYDDGKRSDAALLCRLGLSCACQLPDYPFPGEEEIREKYGPDAETVLSYPQHAGFAHDPVEATPEFQAVYDEVMEEAMAKYLKEKSARIILLLWSYMREGFAARGISWKDPQLMNPKARFD